MPQAAILIELVEALHARDETRAMPARDAVYGALGEAAFVDACAVFASFNAVVKIADATGIPLEDYKAAATLDLRAGLGLDRLKK